MSQATFSPSDIFPTLEWCFNTTMCPFLHRMGVIVSADGKMSGGYTDYKTEPGWFTAPQMGRYRPFDSITSSGLDQFTAHGRLTQGGGVQMKGTLLVDGRLKLETWRGAAVGTGWETYYGILDTWNTKQFEEWKKMGAFANAAIVDKFYEALVRVKPKVGPELKMALEAMLTPAAFAMLGVVLGIWVAGHVFGYGYVVDFGLLAVGWLAIGGMAVEAAGHIIDAIKLVAEGSRSQHLEQASIHLAKALVILGVEAFLALLFKAAGKAMPKAAKYIDDHTPAKVKTMVQNTARKWKIEEFVYALGKRSMEHVGPQEMKNIDTFADFFRKKMPAKTEEQIASYMKATKTDLPVKLTRIEPPVEIVTYKDPNGAVGMYFTKPGVPMQQIGVNPQGRVFHRYKVEKPIEVLESIADDVRDTWTVRNTKTYSGTNSQGQHVSIEAPEPYLASGGNVQYIVPDAQKLLDNGTLKLVHAQDTALRETADLMKNQQKIQQRKQEFATKQ